MRRPLNVVREQLAIGAMRRWPYRHVALLGLALLIMLPVRPALAQPARAVEMSEAALIMSELLSIVEQHGWPADMGRMCVALKLNPGDDCKFKQMAVSDKPPDTVDNYGINVPLGSMSPDSYVVMFHLDSLVGNFFVVSQDGKLKASFYRAKGVDYTEIPIQDARRAFEGTLLFWKRNLPKLNELIASGSTPPR